MTDDGIPPGCFYPVGNIEDWPALRANARRRARRDAANNPPGDPEP